MDVSRSAGSSTAKSGHGSLKTDRRASGPFEGEWLGRPQRDQPAKADPSLPRPRVRASPWTASPCTPVSVPTRERPRQTAALGRDVWRLDNSHRASRASGRAEADLPDPDPSVASGPRRKPLSLIPFSIPISHVEWSRQHGTLPQKT